MSLAGLQSCSRGYCRLRDQRPDPAGAPNSSSRSSAPVENAAGSGTRLRLGAGGNNSLSGTSGLDPGDRAEGLSHTEGDVLAAGANPGTLLPSYS